MDTFVWLKINSLSVFSDECVYTCVGIGWKKRVFGEWTLVTVNMIHLPPIFFLSSVYIYFFFFFFSFSSRWNRSLEVG